MLMFAPPSSFSLTVSIFDSMCFIAFLYPRICHCNHIGARPNSSIGRGERYAQGLCYSFFFCPFKRFELFLSLFLPLFCAILVTFRSIIFGSTEPLEVFVRLPATYRRFQGMTEIILVVLVVFDFVPVKLIATAPYCETNRTFRHVR